MTTDASVAAARDADEEEDELEQNEEEEGETKEYIPDAYFQSTLDSINQCGVVESCNGMNGVVIRPEDPFIASTRAGGNGSKFSEDRFHHPDMALVDPPAFFGVGMPCPRYGWAHAHHCHRRYKKPKFLRPRCVRFPGNRRLYLTSCQWVCDECVREKAAAKKLFEKERVAEKKQELEAVWKETKCTFMAYNEKVFEAYLSNPETAFIPLCVYPYVTVNSLERGEEKKI